MAEQSSKSTLGSKHVSMNGAITAVSGTRGILTMQPDAADAADADLERYDDTTGVKAFRVVPRAPAIALFEAIIFGWSTTASDLTAINSRMSSAATAYSTPDGSQDQGVGLIIPGIEGATPTGGALWYGDLDWVVWDGTLRIKTIAVRSVGANHDAGVLLEVIS